MEGVGKGEFLEWAEFGGNWYVRSIKMHMGLAEKTFKLRNYVCCLDRPSSPPMHSRH